MTLYDNGRLVGATRWNGAFCWLAAPGGHAIEVHYAEGTPLDRNTASNFEDGGRYYLYEDVLFDGFDLDWIDEMRAGRMMQRCEYQLLVDTDTGEHVHPPSAIVPARDN